MAPRDHIRAPGGPWVPQGYRDSNLPETALIRTKKRLIKGSAFRVATPEAMCGPQVQNQGPQGPLDATVAPLVHSATNVA